MMKTRKIKYVIGMTETRRHRPLHAVLEIGELVSGSCDSKRRRHNWLVNTLLAVNIDSSESLIIRRGFLRLKRCGSTPTTIYAAYAPTSSYKEEEPKAFYYI
ncbi:hypothetical protein V3C99_018139 [Haemonchus contortus]|uniref:Uncharacterized protein n=1 Tax=Haemonchus contortus TaxID=6289 RepID=A0A7I4Z510_HAECO